MPKHRVQMDRLWFLTHSLSQTVRNPPIHSYHKTHTDTHVHTCTHIGGTKGTFKMCAHTQSCFIFVSYTHKKLSSLLYWVFISFMPPPPSPTHTPPISLIKWMDTENAWLHPKRASINTSKCLPCETLASTTKPLCQYSCSFVRKCTFIIDWFIYLFFNPQQSNLKP